MTQMYPLEEHPPEELAEIKRFGLDTPSSPVSTQQYDENTETPF